MGALTKNYWLANPDKFSPFRWMGVWCAVYAPCSQMKAIRGVERSRTRRGTKKRGRGPILRRRESRALARAAPLDEEHVIRKILKAENARKRIDKLYDRSLAFCLKLLSRVAETEAVVKKMDGRMADPLRSREAKWGLRMARERFRSKLSTQRSRAIGVLSGVWGIPKDAVRHRIERLRGKFFHAIPRVTLGAFAMAGGEVGASARTALMRAYGNGPQLPEEVLCPCRRCRTSILCDNGHGIGAGTRCCRFCPWVRPGCLGPSVRRADGVGRSERKRILQAGSPLRPR